MKMMKVDSSNIDSIGYDNVEGKVGVIFKKDLHVRYDHLNVPHTLFTAFENAASFGKFYHQHIAKKYPFVKINVSN